MGAAAPKSGDPFCNLATAVGSDTGAALASVVACTARGPILGAGVAEVAGACVSFLLQPATKRRQHATAQAAARTPSSTIRITTQSFPVLTNLIHSRACMARTYSDAGSFYVCPGAIFA